jgi:hypothetical protein
VQCHACDVMAMATWERRSCRRAAVPEDGQGGRGVQLVVQRGGAQRAAAPGARRPRGGAVRPLVRRAAGLLQRGCGRSYGVACAAPMCTPHSVVQAAPKRRANAGPICAAWDACPWNGLLCQGATICKRVWWCRWVDRKGEIPEGKKPYFRLPIMNYYQVHASSDLMPMCKRRNLLDVHLCSLRCEL